MKNDIKKFDLSDSVGTAVVVLDVSFDTYIAWLGQLRPEIGMLGEIGTF